MKQGIHPHYGPVKVVCSCGNTFETQSSSAEGEGKENALQVDICSNCHPFYTGEQKLMDTAGRVDKFRKRFAGLGKK